MKNFSGLQSEFDSHHRY